MNKKEFTEITYIKAQDYAESCVYEPEKHRDAVAAIASDYIEGAMEAYKKF